MIEICINKLNEMEMGYLTGFFIGDGYSNYNKKDRHYKVEFQFNSISDKEIASYIENLLKIIGLNPFRIYDKRYNSFKIVANSKKFMEFLNKQKAKLFKNQSKKYIIGVISGLIDSDGYVSNGEIQITQKDIIFLKK